MQGLVPDREDGKHRITDFEHQAWLGFRNGASVNSISIRDEGRSGGAGDSGNAVLAIFVFDIGLIKTVRANAAGR